MESTGQGPMTGNGGHPGWLATVLGQNLFGMSRARGSSPRLTGKIELPELLFYLIPRHGSLVSRALEVEMSGAQKPLEIPGGLGKQTWMLLEQPNLCALTKTGKGSDDLVMPPGCWGLACL